VIHDCSQGKIMVFWKRSTPKPEAPQQQPRPAVTPKAAPVAERTPVVRTEPASPDAAEPAAPKNGFDPYNSGAFDRRDTWGKVIRK
jgi:hypothetical protein